MYVAAVTLMGEVLAQHCYQTRRTRWKNPKQLFQSIMDTFIQAVRYLYFRV